MPVIFVLKFKPRSTRSIMTTANHADHKIGFSVVIVVAVVLLISLLRIVCVCFFVFFCNKCFLTITVISVAKLILRLIHHLFKILEKD